VLTLETTREDGTTDPKDRPLCVDLDGTLVKSDTLWDSLLVLARRKPKLLPKLPGYVLQGKAQFKDYVTSQVALDVKCLPYNRTLLEFLKSECKRGRNIYLATGADRTLAVRISQHLGIFRGVLASDGTTNLVGSAKLGMLQSRFGASGFDYIGNAAPDLPLLVSAKEAMVANPEWTLQLGLRARKLRITRSFEDQLPRWKAIVRAARLHQWAKNVLVFLPLLLGHNLHASGVISALLAFFCFSFCASATYVLNDLLDLEADRAHTKKRFRPFAAGELPVAVGVSMAAALLLLAFAALTQLPRQFTLWILFYLLVTNAYSFWLKRIALVDVFVLSGLYTLRMVAGAAATNTPISHWLAGLSIFLFLSLAMVKRYSELQNLRAQGAAPANGRGYLLVDADQLRSFGTASAYSAVVVFSIYITGREVVVLYRHPGWMWLIDPLMLLWLNRVWLLASRGEMNEDPVVFAMTDRMSILIGIAVLIVALLAL
jgi:4-hydroxybenzoate polyprenyltransferase